MLSDVNYERIGHDTPPIIDPPPCSVGILQENKNLKFVPQLEIKPM